MRLRVILDYLGLEPASGEAERITGLTGEDIGRALRSPGGTASDRHVHIAAAAEVVLRLRAAREAATDGRDDGESRMGWLRRGRVATSSGYRGPLEVLSDDDLTREVLEDLNR